MLIIGAGCKDINGYILAVRVGRLWDFDLLVVVFESRFYELLFFQKGGLLGLHDVIVL